VVIYISMSIDGVAAMQACARIGATHSVVFGGFSAQSLRDRIEDTGAVAVITADHQVRGGKQLPLKSIVDEALALGGCDSIKNVLVVKRSGSEIAMTAGRDKWMDDVAARPPPANLSGSKPSIRCSCCTPPVPPANPRVCSTPLAVTCCTLH
jgi:acetyl-CoA synthetase